MTDKMKIFAGSSNKPLAEAICKILKIKLGDARITRFADGEISVKISENVRGEDVFVVQSTSSPANDNLMELLIIMDALKRSSANRITAVLPYFGYARQDRKDQPRVPITAKLVANLITRAGASRVLTVDLHAGQLQGFFDIPLDHLYAVNVFVDFLHKLNLPNLTVVSPDVGGIKMARAYAKRLNAQLAIVDKRRIDDTATEVMNIMGEVAGRNVVIVDDIAATAGSLIEAAQAVKNAGALDVYAAVTHPVLCGEAIPRLERSVIKKLLATDTIRIDNVKDNGKIEIISVAPLLAEAIKRIHNEQSISILFESK
ncbi:MAG: ribose-phosphate pyrophosphokinase [Candidatus Omnitrophica bacterium]|nr:ribose-phosphate pyrophosphokinase [Candidatus Omnitrophota bacterium]